MTKIPSTTLILCLLILFNLLIAAFVRADTSIYNAPNGKQATIPLSTVTERWKMYANQPPGTIGQPRWRSAQVVDGIAYVHAEESYTKSHGNGEGYRFDSIYTLNESTGNRIWAFTDAEGFDEPTVVDGVVYANDGQNIYALDALTGVTRWNYSVQGGIAWYTPPTEQIVCVGVEGAPLF